MTWRTFFQAKLVFFFQRMNRRMKGWICISYRSSEKDIERLVLDRISINEAFFPNFYMRAASRIGPRRFYMAIRVLSHQFRFCTIDRKWYGSHQTWGQRWQSGNH